MKTAYSTMIALLCWLASPASPMFAQAPGPNGRDTALYSADRPVDFLHMRLELNFTAEGLASRSCEGRVEYTLRPRAAKIDVVRLDAVDMRILAVELPGEEKAARFSHDDKVLTVKLPRAVDPKETFKLVVKYRLVDPPKGMHFVLPNASQPKKPTMVYTMGEPLEARYWFPTHDWPNERWTSDIIVTVPAKYTVVANGVLRGKKRSDDGQSATFHWHNDVPTDPHLVGMVLGELVELKGEWRGKPVLVFTQPGSEAAAKHTFRRVPEMLEFYTKLVGVDFPYAGYNHITVVDHHHGGMEHAGFSFLAPQFLATSDDGDHDLEHTESNYISHMLAHQWFGGIVNYRSVSEVWLNEGFAILLDSSWTSHTDSPHRFECKMWETAQGIAARHSSETGKPLVYRHLQNLGDIFQIDGAQVYYKGAWVLQMLRHQLGEELFWRGVRKYLADHKWQAVESSDLRRALEEVSGHDLEQFFQQWVYGRGVPRLEVEYAWDPVKSRARVTLKQKQKLGAGTPAFAFPLDLYFRSAKGDERRVTVKVTDARHEWNYDFPTEPVLFCVDPRGGLLKTLEVKVPRAMLRRQAQHGPTALARLTAVEALGKQDGSETVEALEQSLRNEAEFWMVRRTAAAGLARMQTEAALAALLRAEHGGIGHPRALAGLVTALGEYVFSPEAHTTILKYTASPKSLYVETAAVRSLGRMRASPELVEKSLKVLQAAAQKPTRRDVRHAAFDALAALNDSRSFETVFELAQPARDDDLRDRAIQVLARLGRHDALRDRSRATLTKWLYDPDPSAQDAAVAGLGTLGDARAIIDLERVQRSGRGEDLRGAAKRAIEAIRDPENRPRASTELLKRLEVMERRNQELERLLRELTDRLKSRP